MTEKNNSKLNEIISDFFETKTDHNKRIPRESVLEWMKNEDIEVLGAVYSFCTNADYYTKIEPSLTANDYFQFVKTYFRRCFMENPHGEWTDTRYEAGWSLVNWFKKYWEDQSLPREYLSGLKEWLADIYMSGDEDVRLCISTAVLEHLFDSRGISKFFSDWQNEQVLKQAFEEAMGCAGKIKGP